MGVEMSPEEVRRVVEVCTSFGVGKVKITGGEPLLRQDAVEVVEAVAGVGGIKEVSMTTNGHYLEETARDLKGAGLDRVNVSLDTLDPGTYSWITGGGRPERVLSGITAAVEVGLVPVKVNMVVMKGVNDAEVWDMVREFSQEGVILQLIELMAADREFFARYYHPLDRVEEDLAGKAAEVRTRGSMHGRRQYVLEDAVVEVVRPMHNTGFCARCTRMRVTPDGSFKPCLMRDDNLVDFLAPLREGDGGLEDLFLAAVGAREPYFAQDKDFFV